MIKMPPARTSVPSTPESRDLASTVQQVRSVLIPRMKDQRSVTRRLLDSLRERVSVTDITAPSLSDSRG